MFLKKKIINIYTDGACKGNPGYGGWGSVIFIDKRVMRKLWGNESNTTNNRMELISVIKGLEALPYSCNLTIISDSQYVVYGITTWLPNWELNNWINTKKKLVKNIDLWKKLNKLVKYHNIECTWVKGHNLNLGNNLADKLAKKGINELLTSTNN